MGERYNFDWVVNDIFNSIVFKLYYRSNNKDIYCGTYEVLSLLSFTGDELDIEFANVEGLTNLINFGIVRFSNIDKADNIVDIPLRKVYMLFSNANSLGSDDDKKINFDEVEAFSVYDDEVVNKNYVLSSYLVKEESEDLREILEIAKNFEGMGMQEKFDAIGKVNLINYNRSKKKRIER